MSTSSIWEQLFAGDVLNTANNPGKSTALSPGFQARLERFMQRNNLMAQRERSADRSNRESINDFLGKFAGLATLGVGAATGFALPVSAIFALWANNAYRQGSKSVSNFEKVRTGKLKTNLETFNQLQTIMSKRALTTVEDANYHAAVKEINKLSKIRHVRYLGESLWSASLGPLVFNARETYKNMSPNAKFNPLRVLGVGVAGTAYKSASGIAKSVGEVIHSAYAAIKPIPKIRDWVKVKFAKVKDPSAAWVTDKLDGFMNGKWLTKAKDAMTKLSQWPPLRETAKA